jgi:peptide/nickel transport system substrate-binding protein
VGWTCDEAGRAENNWSGGNSGDYCSEEYDTLFEAYAKELDPEKRVEMAIQLNDILVNDGVMMPLINRFTPNGKAKTLEGPTYNTFDSGLWNIHEWRKTS